jgi:hypothetical protein
MSRVYQLMCACVWELLSPGGGSFWVCVEPGSSAHVFKCMGAVESGSRC